MTWWEWLLVAVGSCWALMELGRIAYALEKIGMSSHTSAEMLTRMEDHQRRWQLDQEQQG